MNRRQKLQICARFLAGAVSILSPTFAMAQTLPPTRSLDGLWLTDGYGDLVEFQGENMCSYEITTLSCIPSETATRKPEKGAAGQVVFAKGDETFRVFPGTSADTRWLHVDGSVSNILLRRTGSRPEPCARALADTPVTNYQVFWETFAEQYPFFALRHMDWAAMDKTFRPQIAPDTKPDELFRVLSSMINPLHDAHTFINAKPISERFHGFRPSADPMQKKNAARITEIIETKYVRRGLHDYCNKQFQFGFLTPTQDATSSGSGRESRSPAIGYLRIHSFSGYSSDLEFTKHVDTLESALDEIFRDSGKWTGLVIDVRINGGGSDVFGISIASRLATHEYLAYSKVARNDIHDPDHRTPPQPIMVHVSQRPSFRGPVVLLTSADSVSAAETFTMALLDQQPADSIAIA